MDNETISDVADTSTSLGFKTSSIDNEQMELEKVYAGERILDDPWKDEAMSDENELDDEKSDVEDDAKQGQARKNKRKDLNDISTEQSDEDSDYRAPIMDSRNVSFVF